MNVAEWQRVVERINDVWGSKVGDGMAAAWFVDLQGQNVLDVRQAVMNLSRDEDRRPSLAKLLKTARDCRRERIGHAPEDRPGELPEGFVAVIYSQEWAPIAVEGRAPWRWAQYAWPEKMTVTGIDGVPPEDWKEPAA